MKKRLYVLLLLFCSILFFIPLSGCSSSSDCNQSYGSAPSETVRQVLSISVETLNGLGLSGVSITSDNPLLPLDNIFTDANGHFTIETDLPIGTTITLHFSRDGYIINSLTLTIGDNAVITHSGNTTIYNYSVLAYAYIPPYAPGIEGDTQIIFKDTNALLNQPFSVISAPDAQGGLYIADSGNFRIRKWDFTSGLLSTLAGKSYAGSVPGNVDASVLGTLTDLAISSDGETVYGCDVYNRIIVKYDVATGVISTLAGKAGEAPGILDGAGDAARFAQPAGIVISHDDKTLYVLETLPKIIRKVDIATATVSTLPAGPFTKEITGLAYRYDAGSATETLYVTCSDHKIYSMPTIPPIPPIIPLTVVAGSGLSGTSDGALLSASFIFPYGIDVSSDGNTLYVSDFSAHNIRKIDLSAATVSTLAGDTSNPGYKNGTGLGASFLFPANINLSNDGTLLYVPDTSNNCIRCVNTTTGATTKILGSRAGFSDGVDADLTKFYGHVYGLALTSDAKYLYASDASKIWKIDTAAKTKTEVGVSSAVGPVTRMSITMGQANYSVNQGLALSKDEKTLYIADSWSHCVRALDLISGTQSVIAGVAGTSGNVDGVGSVARFHLPAFLTLNHAGDTIYVADSANHNIKKIDIATKNVTTVAGSTAGYADGVGTAAKFELPCGLQVTPDDKYMYIADSYNNRVRKMDLGTYEVSTYAGSATRGAVAGIGTAAQFDDPRDLALSSDGKVLFVTNYNGSYTSRIITDTAAVSFYAGRPNVIGHIDGIGNQAYFRPTSIVISQDGSILYSADSGNSLVRQMISVYSSTYTP